MGLSDWPFSVGQGVTLCTRGELSWKRTVIIMFLVIILVAEVTDAISDFGYNSLSIQSNEELFRSKAKTAGTRRRKVRYTVRLHLPDIQMSRHLNDTSSSQYKTLSRALSRDILRLFANTAGKHSISNMRFTQFQDNHKEPGSLNEAGSAYQAIHPSLSPPSAKTLSLTSTMPPSLFSSSRKRTKQRGTSALPFPRSTVAVVRPSKRRTRLPLNQTMTTAKLLVAGENFVVVTTATTTVPPTTMAATTLQTTTPTRTSSTTTTTAASETAFNVAHITRLFKDCYARSSSGDYIILLEKYLDAYTELMSIFKLFGPVFTFAGDDVKDKLVKLRALRKRDMERSQNNYISFQAMFEYEHSPSGSPAGQAGVATNKGIHRALKFISELIKSSLTTTSGKSLGDHAQELYAAILAPDHPWYVRSVAYLALLSFPTRSQLLEQMGLTESAQDLQALTDLSSSIEAVYEDVENLYVKYST